MRVHLEDIALSSEDPAQLRAAVPATQQEPEQPMPVWDFIHMQRRLYPYEWTNNRTLGSAQFLIDRDGLVRWTRVQGVPSGLGNYPSEAELLAAAEALSG